MMRLTAALLLTLAWASSSIAQTPTQAQQDACRPDYEKFCIATIPGGGRILKCLQAQGDKLSPACSAAIRDGLAKK